MRRGDGSGWLVTERQRGRAIPSSYPAARSRLKGVRVLPNVGLRRLLHQPLNLRKGDVLSHGSVSSLFRQTLGAAAGWTKRVTSTLLSPCDRGRVNRPNKLPSNPFNCLLTRPNFGLKPKNTKNEKHIERNVPDGKNKFTVPGG